MDKLRFYFDVDAEGQYALHHIEFSDEILAKTYAHMVSSLLNVEDSEIHYVDPKTDEYHTEVLLLDDDDFYTPNPWLEGDEDSRWIDKHELDSYDL